MYVRKALGNVLLDADHAELRRPDGIQAQDLGHTMSPRGCEKDRLPTAGAFLRRLDWRWQSAITMTTSPT